VHFLVTVAVLVQASDGASARRDEAIAALEAAARARGADVVDDALELWRQGWTAKESLAFFADGTRLMNEGRQALARVELSRAEDFFASAERVFHEHERWPGAQAEEAEAAKWRGVARFELKMRRQANDSWASAKQLEPTIQLTESMVRPDVVRAFADVPARQMIRNTPIHDHSLPGPEGPSLHEIERMQDALRVDNVVVAAIAVDGNVIHYAATRRGRDCGTETLKSTRADDLLRRLDEAPCRAGAPLAVERPAIAPRPQRPPVTVERRPSLWRRPWLWVTLVGTVGVGVVVAVSLWPRDPSYSLTLDFHPFALERR
jgi:hypothetical protein